MAALFGSERVSAQLQFAELPREHAPRVREQLANLEVADLDGDGKLDIAVACYGLSRLLLGDGQGVFVDATEGHLPMVPAVCHSMLAIDVDNDGDLDLYQGHIGQDRLYRNDGGGVFTDVTTASLPVYTVFEIEGELTPGDIDGDGDVDIICRMPVSPFSTIQPFRVYRNDAGVFTDVTSTSMPSIANPVHQFELVDVDGDGDRDLVMTGAIGRLLLNNGSGTFTDASAQMAPIGFAVGLAAPDIDGDGDVDLVIGKNGQDQLLQNDGSGMFTDVTAGRMPVETDSTTWIAPLDADGDGDADLVMGTSAGVRVYRNVQGTFVNSPSQLPPFFDGSNIVRPADLDGDGDVDLVVLDGFNLRVWLNAGTGLFHDATARPFQPQGASTFAGGDLDGDGDVDVLGARFNQGCSLFRNDGTGWFQPVAASTLPVPNPAATALALGDVDGDGDLDALLGTSGQDRQWQNDGSGVFVDVTATTMPPDSVATSALALADLDGDGDLDLVAAGGGHHRLYRNVGGVFQNVTSTTSPSSTLATTAVATGDLDGDGDLDLVFSFPSGPQHAIYMNDGLGTFSDQTAARLWHFGGWYGVSAVALADIEGDGDLDLLFGCQYQDRLFVNSGNGYFAEETLLRLPLDGDPALGLAVGDVDGDGDVDLLCGNASTPTSPNSRSRLYVNDGAGFFFDATFVRLPITWGAGLLVDVDQDADPDLIDSSGLWSNLRRQLRAPLLARVGRSWRLEVQVQRGPAGAPVLAAAWLGTTRTSIAVPPFGTLGIVPSSSLPLLVVPPATGVASISLTVPNAPALVGAEMHAQALLWDGVELRLGNVVSDVIVL